MAAAADDPADLLYHPAHAWARLDADDPSRATIGVTAFAQRELGEVVFVEPPELGARVAAGEPCAGLESLKAFSDVIAPLSGEVVARNDALADEPATVNDDPYGAGWLLVLRLADPAERDALLDAAAYAALLG